MFSGSGEGPVFREERMEKRKEFLVCIDSDGCVMDTMDLKHDKCLAPCMLMVWDLGKYKIELTALRDRLISKAEKTEYNSMNVLSMHALIGAYRPEGYEWVDELCQVIDGNMEFACNYIREHFEGVRVSRPQGTYMLFVDFEGWCQKTGRSMDQLIKAGWDVGVAWQDGRPFHGEYSIRINLALPRTKVQEAFGRLNKYVINA